MNQDQSGISLDQANPLLNYIEDKEERTEAYSGAKNEKIFFHFLQSNYDF